MKNKIIKSLFVFVLMFVSAMYAMAITSDKEIQPKLNALKQVSQYNFLSLINKNEVIGYRLSDFNSQTAQYVSGIVTSINRIESDYKSIQSVRNSSEISDSEKEININGLYQDIDTALYDVDSKTINYLIGVKSCLSTITYTRFVKKYQAYYNSLRINQTSISVQ